MSNHTIEKTPISEPTNAHIRWMIRGDMPEILSIEQESFPDAQRWGGDDFLGYLSQTNCIGMVAEKILDPVPCTDCEDGLSGPPTEDGERPKCDSCGGSRKITPTPVVGFMVYELFKDHLRLINMAVHQDFRGQGVACQMVEKLRRKLSPDRRKKVVVLMPESLKEAQRFCEHYDLEMRTTGEKGVVTFKVELTAMTKRDVDEVQSLEDSFMRSYGKDSRNVGEMLAKESRYGVVARDQYSGDLLGVVLYSRELSGIDVNGEFGVMVKSGARRRGIGRKLMMELVNQKLPITVSDICLTCNDQVGFLKAVGVPVPKLERFVTVKWEPKTEKT